jgi:protein SCO1/2
LQTQQTERRKSLRGRFELSFIFAALLSSGCTGSSSFDAAIERSRETTVDDVAAIGKGAPFYTEHSLNPVWDASGKTSIVRIPEIKLTAQDGKPRDEKLFRGKKTFVAFFFASCGGFCPTLVKNLQKVERELGATNDLQFVLMSVDPENDTPPMLRGFASKMQLTPGKWTLLTGDRETIYSLARDRFASQAFQRVGATPRRFVHSEHFYVIDEEGRLRGVLNGNRPDAPKEASKLMAQLKIKQGRTADSSLTPAAVKTAGR